MEEQDAAPAYHIWGIDNTAYGPIELPTLVNWIKEERVLASTWVFVERENAWCPAQDVSELKILFKKKGGGSALAQSVQSGAKIEPGDLRRIRALVEMTDEQLAAFLSFAEIVEVRQFSHVVKRGDSGDTMYGVLAGELRSCILVDGKECPVATLGPGSIFGEISLFDRGPHAAEVIANQDSVLVKLSAQAVTKISKEAPEAAFAMLMGLIKAIAGRVRTLTKRYEDSVHNAHRAETLTAA
jgi:CRP-like cAMP-binding protein